MQSMSITERMKMMKATINSAQIDVLAQNYGWTREEVVAWLESGGKPRRNNMNSSHWNGDELPTQDQQK